MLIYSLNKVPKLTDVVVEEGKLLPLTNSEEASKRTRFAQNLKTFHPYGRLHRLIQSSELAALLVTDLKNRYILKALLRFEF